MPDTSIQSMGNVAQCDTSDNQWNQDISINNDNVVGQNATPLEWNQLSSTEVGVTHIPTNNGTQSEYQFPNGANNMNGVNPPSYYNVAYQRNGSIPHNSFPAQNPQRSLINPNGSSYLIRNALNGTGLVNGANVWPNQNANIGRFVGQQQPWTGSHKTGGVRKQKRIRTAFTSSQMMELEQEYNRTRYLDRTRRLELAELLRLNERTIKIWFQNRRMKEKKIKSESLEESDELEMEVMSPKMGSMLIHEQPVHYSSVHPAEANYEMYREGVYVEQYPVSSTPTVVQPAPNQIAQIQPGGNDFPTYVDNQCPTQYQQLHFQLQHYAQPYNLNIEELSPESTAKSENSTNASSDIVDKSWDLSWIRSINSEEDY